MPQRFKEDLMSSGLYIVKRERLSTGQPHAANVAFNGTAQPATTPVNILFRHCAGCLNLKPNGQIQGAQKSPARIFWMHKKYM
jgi:hypothetical protein